MATTSDPQSATKAQTRRCSAIAPPATARQATIWLVVSTYPSEKYEFVSWDYHIWKNRKKKHQPVKFRYQMGIREWPLNTMKKNQIWIDHINALTWNGCFYWDSYQCNSHRSSDMSKWGRSTLSRFQINWFVAWVAWNVVTMWYPHHSRPTQTTHELWRNSWLVDIHLFRWTSKDSIADDWIFSATCFVKKKHVQVHFWIQSVSTAR